MEAQGSAPAEGDKLSRAEQLYRIRHSCSHIIRIAHHA
jgi:hypothetical protein